MKFFLIHNIIADHSSRGGKRGVWKGPIYAAKTIQELQQYIAFSREQVQLKRAPTHSGIVKSNPTGVIQSSFPRMQRALITHQKPDLPRDDLRSNKTPYKAGLTTRRGFIYFRHIFQSTCQLRLPP